MLSSRCYSRSRASAGPTPAKEAVNSNVLASNYFSFLPGEERAADESTRWPPTSSSWSWIERSGAAGGGEGRALEGQAGRAHRARPSRATSPSRRHGEGKKELPGAKRQGLSSSKRDRALKQDPYFDYAEALLQIAIVLISISIVASQRWLAWFGGALGGVGALLMLNGFHLLIEIPWLA